jgi:hypothetical protein
MPGLNTFNLGFSKKTPFWGENRTLEFKIDMWNAFNHPSFTLGTGTVTGTTVAATSITGYITPTSPQFLDKTQFSGGGSNAPFQRIIQWGLKLNF